jgi:hypothetical protein
MSGKNQAGKKNIPAFPAGIFVRGILKAKNQASF